MFTPSLELIRQTLGQEVQSIQVTKIKNNAGPSTVLRLNLEYRNSRAGLPAAILKWIGPDWPDDDYVQDRGMNFYRSLLPQLPLAQPELYHAGVEADNGVHYLLMEDLSGRYRFPPATYRWRPDEISCFLRSYARLHVFGRAMLPPADRREWMLTYQRPCWEGDALLQAVSELVTLGIWAELPCLSRLVERAFEGLPWLNSLPATLLHGDLYPPNIGLPEQLDGEAALIDWEMGGWGLGEFDLAYLFLQPYNSASQACREEALRAYWSQRLELEGRIPAADERAERLWAAEVFFALAEVMVARRVARSPFPAGSAPAEYWSAMYPVLYTRLLELCKSV